VRIKNINLLLLFLAIVIPFIASAQFGDPGGDPEVPIDGGLSILLAAGAGYVVKKAYDRKKRKEKDRNENI